MNKNIIYARSGTPWNFSSNYVYRSYFIKFKELSNFAKDGPLCGDLFINNVKIIASHFVGFGGPVIFYGNFLYLPLYQYGQGWFMIDSLGIYIAVVDLTKLTFRIIGKKYDTVFLDHIENDKLYFYDSPSKEKGKMKFVNIQASYQPLTWLDRLRSIYHKIINMFY